MIEHLYTQLVGANAKKARAVWRIARENKLEERLSAMFRMGGRCG